MAPYWYISGFLLLISIVEILLKKDERTTHILTYLLCISAVTLVIFGGIRGLGTGMDDYQYRSFFADFINRLQINGFANTVAFYRYEPLIFALAYVTHLFSQNADVFLFIFCLLAVAINATFFKKMSPYPILALALYSAHIFINKDMNQIRFGLSSALFLGVIWYIYLKRYWMATTFAILSFLSHNTAVMVVSIVPFLFIRDSRWWPVAIILLSVPASKVGGTSFVSLISAHLGAIGERAENYNNQYASGAEGGVYSISNFKNILLVFIFVYFMLSNEIKKANYQQYRLNYLLILTFSLGGAIRIFFYNYSSGARLSNYLLQVEPVIISLLVYQVKPILKPAMFAMFAFFLVYYLYYNTISLKQAVVGYEVAQSFRLFH